MTQTREKRMISATPAGAGLKMISGAGQEVLAVWRGAVCAPCQPLSWFAVTL